VAIGIGTLALKPLTTAILAHPLPDILPSNCYLEARVEVFAVESIFGLGLFVYGTALAIIYDGRQSGPAS
jgi:hypothetical protein